MGLFSRSVDNMHTQVHTYYMRSIGKYITINHIMNIVHTRLYKMHDHHQVQ
jgi:hypothetical protein